jgi:hypothetical protein
VVTLPFTFTECGLHVLVGLNILGLRHEVGEGLLPLRAPRKFLTWLRS